MAGRMKSCKTSWFGVLGGVQLLQRLSLMLLQDTSLHGHVETPRTFLANLHRNGEFLALLGSMAHLVNLDDKQSVPAEFETAVRSPSLRFLASTTG